MRWPGKPMAIPLLMFHILGLSALVNIYLMGAGAFAIDKK